MSNSINTDWLQARGRVSLFSKEKSIQMAEKQA